MIRNAIIILTGCMLGFVFGTYAFAQSQSEVGEHVLTVEWLDNDGNIKINALRNAILSDTTATGERPAHPDRVYQLKAGGFYWNTNRIEADFPLRIIGEESDENTHPPVIQPIHDDQGDFDETAILAHGDVEFRNFWFLGMSPEGNMGWNPIQFHGDNSTIVLDNLILEYNWSPIIDSRGHGSEIYLTNSHFRNLIYHEQYWAGRALVTKGDHKKVVIENNTFFNIQGTIFQDMTQDESLWFNHNTIVNVGRGLFFDKAQMTNDFITNNLIVNAFWHGETYLEDFSAARLAEEDNQYSGLIGIDHLDPQHGFEDDRIIGILNNATWRDPAFHDYYQAYNDTATTDFGIRAQPLLNQRALTKISEFENMRHEGTIEGENPGFENYPDNANEMIAWLEAFRADAVELPTYWWDAQDRDFENPEMLVQTVGASWPLPENFTYTNNELMSAATGGYPVGDLNWFPDLKQSWEAEKDQLEEQIREGFDVVEFQALGRFEAEAGILSGEQAEVFVEEDDAFAYFEYNEGTITWNFEMENAGEYTVAVNYRNRWDNEGRANNLYVNDEEVAHMEHVNSGGEWMFHEVEGVSIDEGENTLEIRQSWGWIDYANVEIRSGGDVVKNLLVWSAELDGNVTVLCDDDRGCAGGGQYVVFAENAEGGITWNMNGQNLNGGEYRFNFRFRTPDGASAQDLYVNGELAVESSFFESEEADTWDVHTSELIFLDEPLETIELRSRDGRIHVDQIQIFGREAVGTSSELYDELANGFELHQNYPNPFNPTTQISFTLPQASNVSLAVYNVIGQRVAVLANEVLQSGQHTYQFDASNLASGMYLYRLQTDNFSQVRKMTLIK